MSLPVLSAALILFLQVHQNEATFPVAITTAAGGIALLTAADVTAVAGLAVLTKLSGVVGGVLLSRALSSRSSSGTSPRMSHGRRGKRSAEAEEIEIDVALNMLSEMEPEHCYKRIICAASTGK